VPAREPSSVEDVLFFPGPARERLEGSALPAYLARQRWFGGKARRVESACFTDWAELPHGGVGRTFLAFVAVTFADGGSDLYFLPLGAATGPAADRMAAEQGEPVVTRLDEAEAGAVLYDALADVAACAALLDAVGGGQEFPTRSGRIRAFPTSAFAGLRGDRAAPLPVSCAPATSSNSLVFHGRRLLLKLFRRLDEGISPDFEIGRFLTEKTSFRQTPKVAGAIEYHRPGSAAITLAILQERVPNEADGWRHALEELAGYYRRAAASSRKPDVDARPVLQLAKAEPPPAVRELVGDYLDAAETLGRRTAELHLALAGGADDPAFAPEPLSEADLAAVAEDAADQGRKALAALRDGAGRLSGEAAAAARQFLGRAPGVTEGLGRGAVTPAALKTRVHGDYHLGQTLWAGGDYVLIDFEGEPTRTVEERRAKQSPLKDVAGMMRSYHYAAYAGLFDHARERPDAFKAMAPWAEQWHRWTSAAFLRAYRAAAGDAQFLPADPGAFAGLLDLYALDKALYELVYELNNRPDWVPIPLAGVRALMDRPRPPDG
jgi:trehalose synthase-fused probable maltokinase